jgi:HK97 family phage major capsid protein
MKFMKHGEVQSALQNLANQKGAKGYERAKELYLEGVVVTDESGQPLDPSQIEYEVKLSAGMTDAAEPMPAESEEEPKKSLRLAVREAINSEMKSIARPSVVVQSPLKIDGKSRHFKSDETAYRFGRFVAAAMKNHKSIEWCKNNGIQLKGHTEGVNSAGGFLVPEEFDTALITLREQFGVFRRNARIVPMSSDTKRMPRRKSTLLAYAVGEASSGTESEQVFDQVNLVAKKFMVLTTASSEVNEDAFVNLGDEIGREIAYAFALKEDQCGFLGDGANPTYGGITGVIEKLKAVDATVGNIKGLVDVTSTAWSDIDIPDLLRLPARLPAYADSPSCKWYCHKTFYHEVMEKEAYKSGGVTAREVREGTATPVFYGYPVEFVQVMPKVYADSSVPLLFGDLSMAAYFGDRKQTAIAFSDSALNAFEQDEIAVRGSERFDINVANVGDTTDAGPIIGMFL